MEARDQIFAVLKWLAEDWRGRNLSMNAYDCHVGLLTRERRFVGCETAGCGVRADLAVTLEKILRPVAPSHVRTENMRVVFFHLPRTGGTALVKDVLLPNFPQPAWCHVNYDADLKPIDGAHDPVAWTESQRGQVLLLAGHMPFGLAEHFPGPSEYVTFLRHPVTRTVSDYYFCRKSPSNPAHEAARKLSLIEFVEGGYGYSNNCYARWLSNAAWGAEFSSDREMLQAARSNLARFSFIGYTEQFDVSLTRLCERYNLAIHAQSKGNRNEATPYGRELSARERKVLRRHNRLDLVIYEECKRFSLNDLRFSGKIRAETETLERLAHT